MAGWTQQLVDGHYGAFVLEVDLIVVEDDRQFDSEIAVVLDDGEADDKEELLNA